MGLTIHWEFKGPKTGDDAKAILEKLRQKALDLPFESVSQIVHFEGEDASRERGGPNDEFGWLKTQAQQLVWNKEGTVGSMCPPTEIIGFEIGVAPGSEPMNIFLATYPASVQVTDQRTGMQRRLRTELPHWSGRSFCKTQYASDPRCGGVTNFLRAHLAVCRMLEYAGELGLSVAVSDESKFYEQRDVAALIKTIGEWNEQLAALVGAVTDKMGKNVAAPILGFPNFEHLEAKGQNQLDAFLRMLKDDGKDRDPAAD